jgi:hypothetical protein
MDNGQLLGRFTKYFTKVTIKVDNSMTRGNPSPDWSENPFLFFF